MKNTKILATAAIAGAASLLMSVAPAWAQARSAESAMSSRPAHATVFRSNPRSLGLTPLRLLGHGDPVPAVLRQAAYSRDTVCDDDVNIESAANGEYVVAETGYSGSEYAMLRTESPPYTSTDLFDVCVDNDLGVDYIVSAANGLIVSAELGYTGNNYAMLRARSSSVGGWESFSLECTSDGYLTILAYANSDYVSAELGYTLNQYGMLRARSSSIGAWEKFNTVGGSILSC